MGLEQAFEAPWTLGKLRSGPLGHFSDGFCDWLLSQGFSRHCVRKHLGWTFHLNQQLSKDGNAPRMELTSGDLEGFWKSYPNTCQNRGPRKAHLRRVGHSIHRFTQYLRLEGCCEEWTEPPLYQPLLEGYLEWMRDHQQAAAGTLKIRRQGVRAFLTGLGSQATVEGLSELSAEQIEAFFLDFAETKGHAARRSMQSALRTFLRFCLYQGYLARPLEYAVPTLRTYRLSRLPVGVSEPQAQRVLETIDRNSPVGRRDFAILQMLHSYGVRGGQIRALRLEDICWEKDQILFRALKNGKDSLLPLIAPVGESLLDYLHNARPPSAFPEVFLTCRAPFHPLTLSSSLSEIVARRLRAAGVDMASLGAHAFRHAFATRMVADGHSLKAVADVLGHRHLSTTFHYTKVDFQALQAVALDWPEKERS